MSTPNLIGLDFEDIKTSIKQYFKKQEEWKDYNFDGSGLNILIGALADDAQRTAYMANMIANESNIDTAILRENVVSRAKIVGYVPKSRKASKATISVSINDPVNQSSSLLLPRGTKFMSGALGSVHTFITLTDYNLYLNEVSGEYENGEIDIFEGSIKALSWTVSEGVRCVINDTKIDTDTLKIGVFKSFSNTAGTFYSRALTLEKVKPESEVFWINETDSQRFEIVFGDGVFGKKPENTNIVYAEFISTNGTVANDLSRFTLAGTFAGYENSQITIVTINKSNGGSDSESTSSIKINAPRAYAAQGKATVTEDYKALVKDLYPYANAVNVWGGDEEIPVKYGKVFISVIPIGGGILTNYTKDSLVRTLKGKGVSGIQPIFVDAEYINFNPTVFVNIRKNSVAAVKNFSGDIRTLVKEFFESKFYSFDSSFYYSNLITEIETYSRSITSARVVYELSIDDVISRKEFNFRNAIVEGSVRSNKLLITENVGTVSIKDERGIIYLDKTAIGTVNYETGSIVITRAIVTSTDNTIEIFVTPLNDDVLVSNRSVIALKSDRLSIEIKAV